MQHAIPSASARQTFSNAKRLTRNAYRLNASNCAPSGT